MKFFIVLIISFVFTKSGSENFDFSVESWKINPTKLDISKEEPLPSEHWYKQILDHFNSFDNRKWNQRFFMQSNYYQEGGPIFLILSGESEADPSLLIESFMLNLTKKFKALTILLEHRYYGKSRPKDNLIYLNSEQALMDVAYFVNEFREHHNITRVIVFGSSYAGTLAAWMRFKYPHLVNGVVSQSAPILAKVDFDDFYQVTNAVLTVYSKHCHEVISNSFKEIYLMLRDENGRKILKEYFPFCDSFNSEDISEKKLARLYSWFLYMIESIASNNYVLLSNVCDLLTDDEEGTSIERLAKINEIVMQHRNYTCLPPHSRESSAESLQYVAHPWTYQQCTEFGWYQTSGSKPFKLFSQTVTIYTYLQRCISVTGSSFLQTLELGVERTNLFYGGEQLVGTSSNIVFIHGSNDPWISAGVVSTPNPKISIIIIDDGGHNPLYYPPLNDDSKQVDKAKLQIQNLISSWIEKK